MWKRVASAGVILFAVLAATAGQVSPQFSSSLQFTSVLPRPNPLKQVNAGKHVDKRHRAPAVHVQAKVKKVRPVAVAKRQVPTRVMVRQAPAQPAPVQAGLPSFGNFDPGNWLFNQGLNQLPAPTTSTAGSMVYGGVLSAAGNLIYAQAKLNLNDDRALGNGEVCAIVMNSALNPTIIFPIWTKWCVDKWAKIDLCKEKEYWHHPSPDRTPIPNEAYDAWYLYRYCNGPAHPEYDVFLKEAGYKYPLRRYVN